MCLSISTYSHDPLQAVLITHEIQEQRMRHMAIFEPYLVNEMPTVGLLALMEYVCMCYMHLYLYLIL